MKAFQKPTPVDREVSWDKTKTIMSKTDKYGTIEYANETFVDVSGYEDYELVGQPHNIVRHPDMPKVIFKVLWDNISKGNNFHAVIKNLAKTGRYYWMITDFEILRDDNGKITHFTARRKAVPEEVLKVIEPLYKKLLQIESVSGLDGSEKYFTGFLEERGMNYVEFVSNIMENYEKSKAPKQPVSEKKVEEKGFFARFFNQ